MNTFLKCNKNRRAGAYPLRYGLLIVALGLGARSPAARADDLALPEFSSVNGVLTATLEAKEEKIRLGSVTVDGAVYNDSYGGPVLRVHPGDRMRLTLLNHLPEQANLHFHGLQASPLGNSDNVFISVDSGKSFTYDITIPPTQPPGLYWYHDHLHGLAEKHVRAGLSGALIVEGFAQQFPSLAGIQERLFVLKNMQFDDSPDPEIANNFHNLIQSINGLTFTNLTMRPGETQLWELTNQSANLYFHISLKDHVFRVIGDDGYSTNKETQVRVLDIMPASRVSVLVDAGAPGSYDLLSERVQTGSGAARTRDRTLGTLTVAGLPDQPRPTVTDFPVKEDLSLVKVDARRVFTFSQLNDDEHFFIDGKIYDHNRIDVRVPLGNVEEWTLKNDSDDYHVFHIHQVDFQVTEINGQKQPFNGYLDTTRIPERGEIKIRIAFTNPTILGEFVFHCHVLQHEDHGMMANIEIYDPKSENWLSGVDRSLSYLWWSLIYPRCQAVARQFK